jgi:hypothetical protein
MKKKNYKSLDPSLGVNRMWTKRNDHAPNSECAGFFNICPKREILKNNNLIILLSSSSLSPKNNSFEFYLNKISLGSLAINPNDHQPISISRHIKFYVTFSSFFFGHVHIWSFLM